MVAREAVDGGVLARLRGLAYHDEGGAAVGVGIEESGERRAGDGIRATDHAGGKGESAELRGAGEIDGTSVGGEGGRILPAQGGGAPGVLRIVGHAIDGEGGGAGEGSVTEAGGLEVEGERGLGDALRAGRGEVEAEEGFAAVFRVGRIFDQQEGVGEMRWAVRRDNVGSVARAGAGGQGDGRGAGLGAGEGMAVGLGVVLAPGVEALGGDRGGLPGGEAERFAAAIVAEFDLALQG